MTGSSTIRARCSAQHRKPLAIVSALGGGQAIDNVGYPSAADPGLTGNLPANLFQSASHLLPAVGKLRTAIERTTPLVALAVRPFIQQGHTGFLNLGWHPTTASKCFSFLRSRVQACKQARGIKSILVSPLYRKHLSLFASSHGNHHDSRRDGNARISVGETRNVVR